MPLTSSVEQWFQRDGEASWHINSTADPTALCGQTRMRSNIDNTADDLPYLATPCNVCVAVKGGAAVPAVEPVVEPAPKKTRGTRKQK